MKMNMSYKPVYAPGEVLYDTHLSGGAHRYGYTPSRGLRITREGKRLSMLHGEHTARSDSAGFWDILHAALKSEEGPLYSVRAPDPASIRSYLSGMHFRRPTYVDRYGRGCELDPWGTP